MNFIDRQILRIALPAIVSNVTVPLLGLADTAIVGHLGSPVFIGAISVGGMIFNIIYWIFGFLRAGTSGFTSQAFGANSNQEVTDILYRSSIFALLISCLLLITQQPISYLAFRLIDTTPDVAAWAQTYFRICIWGAPAVMLLYGFNGWFIGLQNTRITMTIALVQNIMNVLLSLLFTFGCGMKVAGVALGTVLSQYIGLLIALWLWQTRYRVYRHPSVLHQVLNRHKVVHFFNVNRDIFLRTLCIISVTSYFTIAGARMSVLVLAANTILLQLFLLFSYFMDGFSNAGEALAGNYIGARKLRLFHYMIVRLFRMGIIISCCFTLLYLLGGHSFLSLLTNEKAVLATTDAYFPWIILVPFAGFAAFLWDGIFIGTTSTFHLFLSMLMATIIFFLSYVLLSPHLHNHALWLSFILFLFVRGIAQTYFYRHQLMDPKQFA